MPTETALIPFHGSTLRTTKDGEQVYIAIRPICEHLGIDSKNQIEKLHQDDDFQLRSYHLNSTDGKSYAMMCLPQDQLLGWLFTISSNRVSETARPILKAYRHETMQAINNYWTKGAVIKTPQTLAEALQLAADVERERERLAAQAALNAPKVESFDAYIGTEGVHDFNAAAKAIGWGRNKMLAELRRRGILMSGGNKQNVPYQTYVDRGYFEVKVRSVKAFGFEKVTTTTFVTPAGLDYLRRTLGH